MDQLGGTGEKTEGPWRSGLGAYRRVRGGGAGRIRHLPHSSLALVTHVRHEATAGVQHRVGHDLPE